MIGLKETSAQVTLSHVVPCILSGREGARKIPGVQ